MTSPSPFSPNIPNFQVAWDSTSLGWLKTCPRYYYYQMVLRWQPRTKGIHLAFGGLYASGVERYAHAIAMGSTHDEATLAMVKWVMIASADFVSDDPIKNRVTLVRSLIWNVEDRLGSPFRTIILTNGRPAVELSFSFEAFTLEGEPIYLSGHIDEAVEDTSGHYWVKDDKTTKSALNAQYFRRYSPDNQMSLYSIAGRIVLERPVSGVLVRAAQIGVNFTRFATQQIPRTPAVLTEWLEEAKWWVGQARSMAIANHWPMNDKACTDYGGCPFQGVCSVSPSHRDAWLREGFEQREWNPLQARGDDI